MSLSLASGSAATGVPATDMPTQNTAASHEITFGEEEIADVSLATFYVFDKENGTSEPAYKLPGEAATAAEAAEAATEAAEAAAAEVAVAASGFGGEVAAAAAVEAAGGGDSDGAIE
ncbi:MAG: hypothetical protein WBE50_03895 [Methyloceanibacter sp.]